MKPATFISRSLRFYWRTHVGVVLGTAVATAVLVGALVVGDSVAYSLRQISLRRLGGVDVAMAGADRFFRASSNAVAIATEAPGATSQAAGTSASELALRRFGDPNDLASRMGADVAPVLLLDGSASLPDGSARANQVQVVGVDDRFWRLGPGSGSHSPFGAGGDVAAINEPLARQLRLPLPPGVRTSDFVGGAEIRLRVPVPTDLPRDAPLGSDRDAVAPMSLTVRAVLGDSQFGRFSLRANQAAPFTVFVPLATLQDRLKLGRRANTLLVRGDSAAGAAAAFRKHWIAADAGLQLAQRDGGAIELRAKRVFLDRAVSDAAMAARPGAKAVFTYFVNAVRGDANAAPYCIVAGMDANAAGAPSPIPPGMAADEIVLNQWLADDVNAKPGDSVDLAYMVPRTLRTFATRKRTFRVRSIIPVQGTPGVDRWLMPDFPGLAEMKDCRDWKPGIPIDLKKLRKKDELYWNQHHGTPKAFVTLAAAREMWANQFGDTTAVRFPAARIPGSATTAPTGGAALENCAAQVLAKVDPAALGIVFRPVRAEALSAANPTSDFGELFIGMSFFLIFSAALLTALLFVLNVEQRRQQTGLLLAIGFRPWRVRRWLLAEGALLAVVGSVLGAAGGLLYTKLVLHGLATVWRGTMSTPVQYHVEAGPVLTGAASGVAVAVLAMLVTLLVRRKATARELLAERPGGGASPPAGRGKRVAGWVVGALCVAGAAATVATASGRYGADQAEAFFNSGGLLLLGTLSIVYSILAALGGAPHSHARAKSLTALGARATGRRRWRSLVTAGLLAFGVFLLASVEVFRVDPHAEAARRDSGTGGFALWGESATPILYDLDDAERRKRVLGADEAAKLAGARVVQLRVREGDDASCLNLNRAQRPRLLAVDPNALSGRLAFLETLGKPPRDGDGWSILDGDLADGAVPAVGDHDTLMWSLHKGLGDDIEYMDEAGRAFKVRIVGRIKGSVLQGSLVVGERQFRDRFPAVSGYRVFLVDAPAGEASAVAAAFSKALEDFGLEMTPAADRLARFAEVQNTYLSIFTALGALGLLLGSVAIGVVVLRNVLERRGELALLRAVGFSKPSLTWMVLCEHWVLLVLGVAAGAGSAAVAVLPALLSPGAAPPYAAWAATIAAVLVSGLVWTYLAAKAALRGDLMRALRSE
jgi:ABC-type lipoprotein release transport system permease subunit